MWFAAVTLALASAGAVGAVRLVLLRYQILDRPNDRSSHQIPTPRGGGIGMFAVLLPAWAALIVMFEQPTTAWILPAAAFGLAAISWVDDLRQLAQAPRLLAQILAVAAGIWALPGPVFGGLLPPALDAVAAGLVWIWFINLFNFMDGIDGMTGIQAVAMGVGVYLVASIDGAEHLAWAGMAIAAVTVGFLLWNWHPAKVFAGDVGSIPLGYLLGALSLSLAATGMWAPALILPLYYLSDATLTLLLRAARGPKPWRAHREHFYQRAVANGRSHASIACSVMIADGLLVALAVGAAAALLADWAAIAGAVPIVVGLLWWLARRPRPIQQ